MSLESVASTLEERGIVWQGVGFALIGAVSVSLLSVYSEAEHWSINAYRVSATQLSWAFVLAIALVIERIRGMFETRTEIRRQAREQALAKAERRGRDQGRDEGEHEASERIRSNLRKHGVELSPEQEAAIFANANGRKR